MDHEENGGPGDRLERIERELARLKAKVEDEGGKDRWDKAQIIVGTIGALLVPLAVAFAGTYFSNALAEAQTESEERRDEASRAIAESAMHVSQAQLIATFMKSLLSTDENERKLAMRAVMLALPEAGPELVATIQLSATDTQTQMRATTALNERREKLVESVYSSDQAVQQKAADHLVMGFRQDPLLIGAITRQAQRHGENAEGLYNSAKVLQAVPTAELQKQRPEVQKFTRIARRGGARAQAAADKIDKESTAADH